MGNITELSQGSLEGLKKQVCECIDHAQAEGYKRGYTKGKNDGHAQGCNTQSEHDKEKIDKAKQEGYDTGYNEGLENAWEMVRAIHDISVDEKEVLYGYCLTYKIVEKLDVHKAFEIYKSYEQAKQEVAEKAEDEIKVGDIVVWEDGRKDFPFIITLVKSQTYVALNKEGGFTCFTPNAKLKKIGNVSDKLETLLDKLKGDK